MSEDQKAPDLTPVFTNPTETTPETPSLDKTVESFEKLKADSGVKLQDVFSLKEGDWPKPFGTIVTKESVSPLKSQYRLQIKNNVILSDIDKDYIFFNHGLLYCFQEFDVDPLKEFFLVNNVDTSKLFIAATNYAYLIPPNRQKIVTKFSSAYDSIDWSRMVFCCDISVWPSLYDHLSGVAACMMTPKGVYFMQVGVSNVRLPDFSLPEFVPDKNITVHIFCPASTEKSINLKLAHSTTPRVGLQIVAEEKPPLLLTKELAEKFTNFQVE